MTGTGIEDPMCNGCVQLQGMAVNCSLLVCEKPLGGSEDVRITSECGQGYVQHRIV